MSKVRFELNRAGVRELLQSDAAKAVCADYANRVKARAGEGYEVTTYTGRTRVNASVSAETYEAKQDNYENNTLLKSLR